MTVKTWDISSKVKYFHADDIHELPCLLKQLSDWLIETSACVEAIDFVDRNDFIELYVIYDGKFIKPYGGIHG